MHSQITESKTLREMGTVVLGNFGLVLCNINHMQSNAALVCPQMIGVVYHSHLSGNGDLNLNTGLDVDDDLLDDLGRSVKVDQTLVDSVVEKCQPMFLLHKFAIFMISLQPLRASSTKYPPQRMKYLQNSPHLVHVPGLGALTARGLAGGDLQVLGGHADGALDAEVLGLGAVDELLADLLEGGDLSGGEGDADLVDLGLLALLGLLGVVGGHVCGLVGRCDRDCG